MKKISFLVTVVILIVMLAAAAGCGIKEDKPARQDTGPQSQLSEIQKDKEKDEENESDKATEESVEAVAGSAEQSLIEPGKEENSPTGAGEESRDSTEAEQGTAAQEDPAAEPEALGQDAAKQGDLAGKPSETAENEYITFVDGLGETVRIKKQPQRVISLYNSYTNLWYSAGGKVIGRIDSTSQLTKKALNAEICGSMGSPNVEKILSLQPDMVILSPGINGQKALIPVLKQNNIPYLAVLYETLQEYLDLMKVFTDLTGRADLFEQAGAKVKREVDSILARVPGEKKPSVLLLFGTSTSVSVRLPNSTVGAMLEDLGTVNIAQDARLTEAEMQVFSMERILEKDPDFIFVQTMGDDVEKVKARVAEQTSANPAWKNLTAVKEGRYIILPKDLYLYKPNERYGEAYEGLAKILYPEVFK